LVPVAIKELMRHGRARLSILNYIRLQGKFGKPLLPEDLEKEGLKMGTKDPYEAICLAARKALVELKEGRIL
jgi:hypothetical protein